MRAGRGGRASALALALALTACGDGPLSPDPSVRFVTIAAGGDHTCALDEEGAAWCWGSNSHGQLGVSDGRDASSRPLGVAGGVRFRMLSLGARHTCGIDTTGGLWCWGANGSGQVGDGTASSRREPRAVVLELSFSHVAAGVGHTCAVDSAARMWCWGANDFGQLGEPLVGPGGTRRPVLAARGIAFSSAAAGRGHTCGVTTEAAALCWGRNDRAQLGGATGEPSSLPIRVSGTHAFRRLTAGERHTCGVTSREAVLCWGSNEQGELGVAGGGAAGTPVPLGWRSPQSAVDTSPGGRLTCAVATGTLLCWGAHRSGGVALRLLPHAVAGLPAGAVAGAATGADHACALADGAAWCWGEGDSGQLGDGRQASSAAAVAVEP